MTNKKLVSYLILILCVTPFLDIWGAFANMEKALSREPVPIPNLILGSFEYWGMTQLIIGLFGWLHFRLLMDFFEKGGKERQLAAIRYGTLGLVLLVEAFAFRILMGRVEIALVAFYAIFFSVVSLVVVAVVAKILGLKRFEKNA